MSDELALYQASISMHYTHFILFFFFLIPTVIWSQGAVDGYMKGKGNTDLALTYSRESYNRYFFGEEEQEIENKLQSLSLYFTHGLQDSLDVVVSIPFIRTDSLNSSFQDAIIAVKFRNERIDYANGNALSVITSVGLSFPLAAYPIDTERPIGVRAVALMGRFITQYEFKNGVFLNLQAGYDFRIAPTALSSIPVIFRMGYAGPIYFDVWLDYFKTFDAGVDMQITGGQGSTWLKTGGTIYYPIRPKFGVFIGIARYLFGKNIGLATRGNVGVVFKL